jgi:hypothetical protein
MQPDWAPPAEGLPPGPTQTILENWLTQPGERPHVFQRAVSTSITAGVAPVPIMNQRFDCDTIVLDVPTTAANSVFFGFGSGVTVTSGIEIRPGLPIAITPDNNREQWELQRMIEMIAAMMAVQLGFDSIGQYRAPKVVFNANEYFVVAAATTVMSALVFYVPEMQ